MRKPALFLTLALGLTLAGPAAAQAPKVRIDQVRVGFPAGKAEGGGYKLGSWFPVYVDVTAGPDGVGPQDGAVTVEAIDSDEVQNLYSQPLPPLAANEARTLITYARTANAGNDLVVTLRGIEGRGSAVRREVSVTDALEPGNVLYVTAGTRLSRLRATLRQHPQGKQAEEDDPDTGPRRFAWIDAVNQMPTRWYGYGSVDILFLCSGNQEFVQGLLEDQQNRKEALAEWVRQGGRLVVSAGRNQQFVAQLLGKMKLINCDITGTYRRLSLRSLRSWAGAQEALVSRRDGQEVEIEATALEPGPGTLVLAKEPADDKDKKERPLVVLAPSGLGRVLLVGIDIDQAPFTAWGGQPQFWKRVQLELEPKNVPEQTRQFNAGQTQELGSLLSRSLETFDDVPVVSFAWVALFIFLYILVVGPLDYLFLKKVVKRLELTWVTFPAVVVLVSAAAYFTAYHLKGNDLRVNKVDVLDIDLETPRAYGTTWFTLFSPNIRNYTVGVSPGWGLGAGEREPAMLTSWLARPEEMYGGIRRTGSQSFFRRPYEYAPNATGMVGVPVQVWSTKSFQAQWHAGFNPNEPPFAAELKVRGEREQLSGTLTSSLPAELEEAVLIYRGRYYTLGKISTGVPRRIDDLGIGGGRGGQIDQWLSSPFEVPAGQQSGQRNAYQQPAEPIPMLTKNVLFHEMDTRHNRRNSALRWLDQGWRLQDRNRDEVIVCGRLTPKPGRADSPDDYTPTHLWLEQLPVPGQTPPAPPAKLRQETYVRVYIPVTHGD